MKIACDFVSPHNLRATAALLPQQRRHRLQSDGHGEDVLQFHALLWFAWLSVSTHLFGEQLPGKLFSMRQFDQFVLATSNRSYTAFGGHLIA